MSVLPQHQAAAVWDMRQTSEHDNMLLAGLVCRWGLMPQESTEVVFLEPRLGAVWDLPPDKASTPTLCASLFWLGLPKCWLQGGFSVEREGVSPGVLHVCALLKSFCMKESLKWRHILFATGSLNCWPRNKFCILWIKWSEIIHTRCKKAPEDSFG